MKLTGIPSSPVADRVSAMALRRRSTRVATGCGVGEHSRSALFMKATFVPNSADLYRTTAARFGSVKAAWCTEPSHAAFFLAE